nr:hypothetical protein [Tanacetum cinerariifolium]
LLWPTGGPPWAVCGVVAARRLRWVALVADRGGGRGGVGHGGSSPWQVAVVARVIHGGWSGRSCRGGQPEWGWPSVAARVGLSVSWWQTGGPPWAVHGVVAARQ